MTAPRPTTTADRPSVRQIVLWSVFLVLLVVGLVLHFRFADQVAPFLDSVIER